MPLRRRVGAGIWAVLTLGALGWAVVGRVDTGLDFVLLLFGGISLGYGTARLIALHRMDRERPLRVRERERMAGVLVTGLLVFVPLVLQLVGTLGGAVAWSTALLGLLLMSVVIALFSDGRQGFWLDSLVFYRRLVP